MAASMKRSNDAELKEKKEENEDLGDDDWIGPVPEEAAPPKKKKVLQYEKVYLDNLPSSPNYEKSFMHRDTVTHCVSTKSNFVITASLDGHVKFWKKTAEEGTVFVKHFRTHLEPIVDLVASPGGEKCCTISTDKSLKVFDVVNFDMINMMRLDFVPWCACWVYSTGDAVEAVAVADENSSAIHIYDGASTTGQPIHTIDNLHMQPVTLISYNPVYDVAVSSDNSGMLQYWSGPKQDYKMPKCARFESALDTDLYEFLKVNAKVRSIQFSPNGQLFATLSSDKKVRLFKFLTGKITKVIDESLQQYTELQQMTQQVPNMEFGRRVAVERDLDKSENVGMSNIIFDETGNFVLYATLLGIKVVNLHTNSVSRLLGKTENIRFLHLSLLQGAVKKYAGTSVEMQASDNPLLASISNDPMLFTTAYKKNRFYIFSKREAGADAERDVFNEKPTKEEIVSATEESTTGILANTAVMHTSMGDIGIKLFPKECPKAVENFTVHCRNGYYNNHLFHRVIKGFMVQTGDPDGVGTGGQSIWGGDFEDEFHPTLKHDRPFTLSMANAGPNTNGSQFFITLSPTSWLDNKHTVFGRVTKGMEIVLNISNVKTNPRTDKPHDDITVININVK